MFRRMLPWLIMILVVITLITGSAFVLWYYVIDGGNNTNAAANSIQRSIQSEQTPMIPADERMELTIPLDSIVTNLSDIRYIVKLSLSFQLDTKKTKEEFALITPSVKAAVVSILSDIGPDEIKGSAGKDKLITEVMDRVNTLLLNGEVLQIEITDFIIQGA